MNLSKDMDSLSANLFATFPTVTVYIFDIAIEAITIPQNKRKTASVTDIPVSTIFPNTAYFP